MQIIKAPGINSADERTKGCERAGNAVLLALREILSNEQGKPIDPMLLDLEEIHLDNNNLKLTNKLIYKNSFEAFEIKNKVIFLGGDHSISYSVGNAFLDYCQNLGKEPCLIVFDGHPDCIIASKEPGHREWLRALIEKGFPVENILLVGVRNSNREEISFLKEKKIKVVEMNKLLVDIEDICDTIMEFANGKELYVSIDIDVVDPAFAPSTGLPEPGGLSSRDIIYLMQRINRIKSLRAVDIVEINSEKDKQFNGITVKLGAKILSELI